MQEKETSFRGGRRQEGAADHTEFLSTSTNPDPEKRKKVRQIRKWGETVRSKKEGAESYHFNWGR